MLPTLLLRPRHWAGLMVCLLLLMQFVAAAPVPGVSWSKLGVWEGSALADVWARADEYLDFRSYALRALFRTWVFWTTFWTCFR